MTFDFSEFYIKYLRIIGKNGVNMEKMVIG